MGNGNRACCSSQEIVLGLRQPYNPRIIPPVPSKESCAQRARLANALAQAVSDVYARDREYQGAKERKENTFEFSLALENARAAEGVAVDAYDNHIKKHGCRS